MFWPQAASIQAARTASTCFVLFMRPIRALPSNSSLAFVVTRRLRQVYWNSSLWARLKTRDGRLRIDGIDLITHASGAQILRGDQSRARTEKRIEDRALF